MTGRDQEKPYHAKSAAPGQEAADVVAEVLAHAAEREKAATKKVTPKGPPKWMLPLTVNLGVLALYFLIAQPEFLILNPNEETRTVEQRTQSTTLMMGMAVADVDLFYRNTGRLPATLAEANVTAADAFNYTVQNDSSYILIATVDDQNIVYDSAVEDPQEFFAALATRIRG